MSELKWVVWRAEGSNAVENVALERREKDGPLIVIGAVFPGLGMYKGKFLVRYAEKVFTIPHATEAAARAWMEAEHARVAELTWSPKTEEGGNRYAHVGTEQVGHVFQLVSTGKWLGCAEYGVGSPDFETEAEAMAWVAEQHEERKRDIAEEVEHQEACDDGRSHDRTLILDWRSTEEHTLYAFFDKDSDGPPLGKVYLGATTGNWWMELGHCSLPYESKEEAQTGFERMWRREQEKVLQCGPPPKGDRFYRTKPEPAPEPPPVADCSSERLEDRLIEAVIGVVRTRSTQSIFDLQEEEPMTWQAMRALMRERIYEILEDDIDGRLAELRANDPSIPYEQVKEDAKWKRVASCAVTVEGVTMELEELQRVPETPLSVRNFEVKVGAFRLNANDFFAGVENLRVFFDGRRA